MKILCISDAWLPQVNGVVRTYQNIARTLEKSGHSLKVIGPGDFLLTIPAPGYAEIRLVLLARWTLPPLLEAAIQNGEADSIHIATEGPLGRAARRYCLRHQIPFSTSYHTQFPEYLAKRVEKFSVPLSRIVRNFSLGSLKKFHSSANLTMVSTPSLEKFLAAEGFTPHFHRFIRGIDASLYHPGPKTEFIHLKRPIALYVGRVALEKNIEAFLDTPWDGSKVVVGSGPALSSLQHRYPDVVFTGLKTSTSLAEHYRSADVFAFPSKTDTFGITIIEALASGLPVAGYPVTGPVDIITSPDLGTLDETFPQALNKALAAPGSPEMRATKTAEFYTWERAAEQFLAGSRKVARVPEVVS